LRREYVRLAAEEEVIIARDAVEDLRSVEAVIFDCDGVLIDTRRSYDMAILMTVDQIFSKMLHLEFLGQPVGTEEIRLLRSTGGFNNDAYTAHILTLWLFVNLPDDVLTRLKDLFNKEERHERRPDVLFQHLSRNMLSSQGYMPSLVKDVAHPIREVVAEARRSSSVLVTSEMIDKILAEIAAKKGFLNEYNRFKQVLGRPGEYGSGLLETIFSDLYYGEEIVSRIYGHGPYFKLGKGLYTNESIFIKEETLRRLASMLGREHLGIVSGRDRTVPEIVLGPLVKYFNMEASVFIADEEKLGAPPSIEKPSPYSLIKSISSMGNIFKAVYVGNSAEDIMMARNAANFGVKTLFIGVTGLSSNPSLDREMFISMGADAIVETPDSLIDVLFGGGKT
jgi:phosphoglycolate phosphatase-like HAD superfamily hydrolase